MKRIPEMELHPIPELGEYPEWVCLECGFKHAKVFPIAVRCSHHQVCGICGQEKATARHTYFGDLNIKVTDNG